MDRGRAVLAEVGQPIFGQKTLVTVRLPGALAGKALAAWRRDDGSQTHGNETTTTEVRARTRAGTLALGGLSIDQSGRPDGDEVLVDLDAWYIGTAYDAAEEAGLPLEPHSAPSDEWEPFGPSGSPASERAEA